MFLEVFRFECRHQLRSKLFAIVSILFFVMAFLATASEYVNVGGSDRAININATFAIITTQFTFSIIAMFAAVVFVANTITRDYENKTAELFFTTNLRERDYLCGRFLGGFVFAFLATCAPLLGILIGSFMPWLDPERIGAFALAPYWYSIWAVTLPNVFITCGLFFSAAALARSMFAAYVVALGLFVFSVVVGLNTDAETMAVTSVLDPFGAIALSEVTRYWTVFERNTLIPEMSGSLLYSRMLWIGLTFAALSVTALRFRFTLAPARKLLRRRRTRPASGAVPVAGDAVIVPRFDRWSPVRQFASQLRMEVRGIVRSAPFYVLLTIGILNVGMSFYSVIEQWYGTPVLPVTRMMIDTIAGSFLFVVMIIIVYYSGELVHRERQVGLADITDATPYPNGMMVLAKITSLWFIVAALLGVVMLTSIAVQTLNGFYDYELPLYLAGLFGALGWNYFLLCVLAIFIQVLSPNKFVGMLIALSLIIGRDVLDSFGFEHYLYYFFGTYQTPYSDMNGYGHFVIPFVSSGIYWSMLSVVLVAIAHLFFQRGLYEGFADRLRVAQDRLSGRVVATATAGMLAFLCAGSWIFYNTNIVNEYVTTKEEEAIQADYEKAYKQYERMPLPATIDLQAEVDIFPDERRVESRGTAVLVNRTDAPMGELHFTIPPEIRINELSIPGSRAVEENGELGYHRFALIEPLAPQASIEIAWDLSWLNEGFVNYSETHRVVYNGTFVDNTMIMPIPGYVSGLELEDNGTRRENGLGPAERMPKYGDPDFVGIGLVGAERANFRARVSTVEDQIAVAPGYLKKEWIENGRRYFEYEMDEPIWPSVPFLSARYEVVRGQWNDVNLEVFYHPKHAYNVSAMLSGAKKSLDYFTREFTPYQYRQFRIFEFPAYEMFAQSFPNTIPYSEAIGFVADLRDEKKIDSVFFVTAHELAHQWWGHQVAGASTQGSAVITETLAQYSALMVMEDEFGPQMMRRFLKYELDRYLNGRGAELIEELPLMYSENQPYIHYQKGALVMYALQDAIGEGQVNLALRNFLAKFGMKGPPYPKSGDLISEFRAVAGPEHQDLITDLFERILLFDVKVTDTEVTETDDGRFKVAVTVDARKLEADGEGRETEVPLASYLDLGVFPSADGIEGLGDDDLPPPLYFERRKVVSGIQTFEVIVDERPDKVGIDPYNKMIDRNPDDNLRSI
jgi:ABC-type transport system involved in multi-copper enzyme maturation permease subunit